MTSLFDQYEQDSQRFVSSIKEKNTVMNYPQSGEKPIFQKNKINFEVSALISHLAICNEYLVYVTSNNVLHRIELKTLNKQPDIELNRIVPGVKLTGLFLNPTADHLLIGFSTELLYLNKRFSKPKPTSKLRGHEITAVGWNLSTDQFGDSTTKPILLGTSRGIIFEVEISADEGLFTSSIESYCKQVFDLGKGTPHAITGLQYCRVDRSDRYFVIATTVDRLFKFFGNNSGPDERPLLQHLFNKYLGLPEGFQEIPSSLDYSCLQIYTAPGKTTPSALGWLTETGIYYAQMDPTNDDLLLSGTKMFNFPDPDPPTAFLMTDFHILLLYPYYISVLSSLTEQLVYTDYYNEMHGRLLNIIRDPVKGTIWVYAEKAVFRYKVNNEERDVWEIFANKGDYKMAKYFCRDNLENLDKVLIMQAEHYFKKKQFKESALCYADTQAPFEKVALEFLKCDDAPNYMIEEALKAFLKEKVKKVRGEDQAQMTMLVLWLLELILRQLSDLRIRGLQNEDQYILVQAELDEFITGNHIMKCIRSNKRVVYDLMASHGDESNMVKLAKLTEDYKKVIEYFIHKGDYSQALDTLKEQSSADLWYMFAPELIDAETKAMLSAIRSLRRPLDPRKLLPALIAAENSQPDEVIRYLEYCTNDLNIQEQAVHNFFLTLLAQYKPDKLMIYLSIQGEEKSMVNYDIRYAFRVCKQYDRREACVKLSSMLGLWESAVELALSVSVQLAVQTVCQLQSSRKLWLKIAQHVVKEQNNISQAMQFFSQSNLKIEDILPFFPDFVTIDHFKDAICSSLQEYNQHIQDLKEEMEDATKSAEVIRNEIQTFRSKYSVILSTDLCCICDIQLLLRPFYSFPCGHRFHSDCLMTEIMQLLPEKKKNALAFLKKHLESNLTENEKEKTRLEIDSILAQQCLYCGDLMIELIDKPFISEEDYERIKKEWE